MRAEKIWYDVMLSTGKLKIISLDKFLKIDTEKNDLKHTRKKLINLRKSLSYWQHMHITEEKRNIWLIEWQILSILPEIERLEKRIGYLRKVAQIEKDKKAGKPVTEIHSFDIENLKRADILEIAKSFGLVPEMSGHRRAFIKLRNERTPSCCLYLDRNAWYDFGSGDHGDVIDLVGKLDHCDFKSACQRLIYMGY